MKTFEYKHDNGLTFVIEDCGCGCETPYTISWVRETIGICRMGVMDGRPCEINFHFTCNVCHKEMKVVKKYFDNSK